MVLSFNVAKEASNIRSLALHLKMGFKVRYPIAEVKVPRITIEEDPTFTVRKMVCGDIPLLAETWNATCGYSMRGNLEKAVMSSIEHDICHQPLVVEKGTILY